MLESCQAVAFSISPGPRVSAGPRQFPSGAQLGAAAVEALGVRGGVTNAATVYRMNGSPVRLGVSVADLFASPRLELRWKNVVGLGDLSGDIDGDGLTDWDEIFRYDTDPNQSDTDGDGISDAVEVLAGSNPLRNARRYVFGIPSGVEVPFRLFSRGVAAVDLSMSNSLPDPPARLLRSSPNRPQKEFNCPCGYERDQSD